MAMGDSLIGAWDSKVNFNFWRPITAIRLGDSDGSDRTVGDGSSTPRLRLLYQQQWLSYS